MLRFDKISPKNVNFMQWKTCYFHSYSIVIRLLETLNASKEEKRRNGGYICDRKCKNLQNNSVKSLCHEDKMQCGTYIIHGPSLAG